MSAGPQAPRPKRSAEEFARTHYNDSDGPSSKKVRFDVRNPSALAPDAPEEDAVLEADEIGKRGQQTKRNAVNIDGYESDSSNEGFDTRTEAKVKTNKEGKGTSRSKAEEDNDMFADLEESHFGDGDADEDAVKDGKKRKRDVKFIDVEEIEGQVAASKSGGHVSADFSLNGLGGNTRVAESIQDRDIESSSDSEVGDEIRAEVGSDIDEEVGAGGKKKHAPKLDAFNLKAEKEDGRFDEQMNYVRKAMDPDAIHDTWLQGVSKKDMKKAKEAEDKRDQERRQRVLQADAVVTSDILKTLIPLLDRGETALEALARLGRGEEKKKPKWQGKNRNKRKSSNDMEVDVKPHSEDPIEGRRRKAVETITEAANQLLTRGQNEVYDAEKELLIRQYRRETGEAWVDPPMGEADVTPDDVASKQWEYRWSDARDGGASHGPYEGSMMESWNNAGYFGEGVEFRRTDDEESIWSRNVNFV